MRRWRKWMAIVLAAWAGPALAEVLNLEAMLILASNDPAPMDRRLERVEYQLRPVFRFEYYRLLGQGSAALQTPGETTLALGDGHFLKLRGGQRGVEVRWFRGDQALLSTSVNLKRGKSVNLGGVSHGDGKLIVTLTAR